MAGAMLFGWTYPSVYPAIVKIANYGNVVIPDLWHVDPFLTIGVFCAVVLILFYLFEHGWFRKDKLQSK